MACAVSSSLVASCSEAITQMNYSRQPFASQLFEQPLVITDVRLPGMGGEQFLREVRELAHGMPVIVITGADGDESKFIEAGALGYLLKPFRFEGVEEMVERVQQRSHKKIS
jgi:FixJ family two-component response regulator